MTYISPSLLAADFSNLANEVTRISAADMLHLDIMDGCFVPNISMGPGVVAALRDKTPLHFDVHLMLEHPLAYINAFRKAGADSITFHIESSDDPTQVLHAIKESGAKPGIAINPSTPVEQLAPYAADLYMITIMTVQPGFGGQKLMPQALEKLVWLKKNFPSVLLEVDGGVNAETAPLCREKGADVLVAGTAVFKAENPHAAIEELRG